MEKGIKIMAMVGITFVLIGLSGCVTDSPDPNMSAPDSNADEEDESFVQKESFYWSGSFVPWNICIPPRPDYLFCVSKDDLELRPVGPFSSRVVTSFSFQFDWKEESLPSLQGRKITISCNAEEENNCTDFPKTFVSDQSPIQGEIQDLELPQNTTVEIDINVTDPVPDPVQFEFDIRQEWKLEATATFKPVS